MTRASRTQERAGSQARRLTCGRRLICPVPLTYRATVDVAADAFQWVCVDLVAGFPRLRNLEALAGRLARVARHTSLRGKTRSRRQVDAVLTAERLRGAP